MINEPNADEVYARKEFETDLSWWANSHIYTLFNFIKHNVIKKVLLSTVNVFLSSVFSKG